VRGRRVDLAEPLLMGIVNATPDSFSDAGELPDTPARVDRALALLDQGAGIIDVGGQSGITGVPEVEAGEEIDRVVPVVEGILAAAPGTLLSVDTYKPPVVQAVLDAGAAVVNDVSGLLHPEVAGLCAAAGAGLVVMHNRSRPKQRLTDPLLYDDVTGDVVEMLSSRMAAVEAAGVSREAVVLDPGPDFSKTPHQTVTVLREIGRVQELGRPLLLALSRKDFLGAITGRPPRQRLAGTLASIGHLAGQPGLILRVHDVEAVADYLKVAAVLAGRADIDPDTQLAVELRREPVQRKG
jgi:dihydropteroate synthase